MTIRNSGKSALQPINVKAEGKEAGILDSIMSAETWEILPIAIDNRSRMSDGTCRTRYRVIKRRQPDEQACNKCIIQ